MDLFPIKFKPPKFACATFIKHFMVAKVVAIKRNITAAEAAEQRSYEKLHIFNTIFII